MNASKAYTIPWAIIGLCAACAVWLAVFARQMSVAASTDLAERQRHNQLTEFAIRDREARLRADEPSAARIAEFLKGWEPHMNPLADKKDRQVAILRVLEDEAIALQDLLVGAKVTPTGKGYRFGDQTLDVEQVQMKVSGPVAKTLVFLGRAEELFPYARITQWQMEPTDAGRGVNLEFRLVQPIDDHKGAPRS